MTEYRMANRFPSAGQFHLTGQGDLGSSVREVPETVPGCAGKSAETD